MAAPVPPLLNDCPRSSLDFGRGERGPFVRSWAAHVTMAHMLSDQERAILDIAARHPQLGSAAAKVARRELGLSPTRYFQTLDRLVRTRAAIEHDPQTCRRVTRMGDA